MKASDLRKSTEEVLMFPIYEKLRKAKIGGASYIQVSHLTQDQKNILERDGFTINTFMERDNREEWSVTRISWME
jgi:hypothetical protein